MQFKQLIPAVLGGLLASLLVVVDQAVKYWIRAVHMLEPGDSFLLDGFELVHYRNMGIAFGIPFDAELLIVVILATMTVLVWHYRERLTEYRVVLPLSVVIGGALGNLVDRLLLGYVLDYIQIWIFPVFNFADLCIVGGIFWILLNEFFQKKRAA